MRAPIFIDRLELSPIRCDACRQSRTFHWRSARVVRASAPFPAYALSLPSIIHDYADQCSEVSASASNRQFMPAREGSAEQFNLSEVDVVLRSASEVQRVKLDRRYGQVLLGEFDAVLSSELAAYHVDLVLPV